MYGGNNNLRTLLSKTIVGDEDDIGRFPGLMKFSCNEIVISVQLLSLLQVNGLVVPAIPFKRMA